MIVVTIASLLMSGHGQSHESAYIECAKINDSMLTCVCYTVIYMIRVGVRFGLGLV